MRTGLIQLLAVLGLVTVFAAVVPTHHHISSRAAIDAPDQVAHAQDASAPEGQSPPANPHPAPDCPICHAVATMGTLPAPTAFLLIQPVTPFTHPIDQAQPASARIPLPFDGRAPPAA